MTAQPLSCTHLSRSLRLALAAVKLMPLLPSAPPPPALRLSSAPPAVLPPPALLLPGLGDRLLPLPALAPALLAAWAAASSAAAFRSSCRNPEVPSSAAGQGRTEHTGLVNVFLYHFPSPLTSSSNACLPKLHSPLVTHMLTSPTRPPAPPFPSLTHLLLCPSHSWPP
jgi:hypothetical protein